MAFVFKIWQIFKPNLENFVEKESGDRLHTSGVVHVSVLTSYCVLWDCKGTWSLKEGNFFSKA